MVLSYLQHNFPSVSVTHCCETSHHKIQQFKTRPVISHNSVGSLGRVGQFFCSMWCRLRLPMSSYSTGSSAAFGLEGLRGTFLRVWSLSAHCCLGALRLVHMAFLSSQLVPTSLLAWQHASKTAKMGATAVLNPGLKAANITSTAF